MEQMENLLNYSDMQEKLDTYEYYPYMIFGKTIGKYETLMDYSGKIYGPWNFGPKWRRWKIAQFKDEHFPMYQG